MLILLSPAKTLDYDTPAKPPAETQPQLLEKSEELAKVLKQLSPQDLAGLMSISDELAELNFNRFQDWESPMPASGSKPAVLAFKGDVYIGLKAGEMTDKQLLYAQDHLRILSGLYGLLRPLDLMLPYRLEMGTKLKTRAGKTLYDFWGARITDLVESQVEAVDAKFVLNLASNEYFRSVQHKKLSVPVVSPVFKDFNNGKYKVISFFAKQARGTMAAWAIKSKAKTLKKLVQFDGDGYQYDPESSTDAKPVFLRKNP